MALPRRAAWSGLFVWIGFALVLLVAPWVFPGGAALARLSQFGYLLIICLAYNLQLGQGGLLSFCHAVFAGIGGFAVAHLINAMSASGGTWIPLPLMPLAGGLAAAALALPLGFVATRRAGVTFAMITLGLGAMIGTVATMLPGLFGGDSGISFDRVYGQPLLGWTFGPTRELYYLIAFYAFACAVLMYAFTATPLGRMLNAVRDNAERVEFVGYDPRRVRFLAMLIASFFAGVGGALSAINYEIVNAGDAFGLLASGNYLLFTFVGGTTVFYGPILGAGLMVLALSVLADVSAAWMLYLGLAFMLVVMFVPGGVASVLQRHVQLARAGRMRGLLRPYAQAALPLALTLAGVIALIEMLYRAQGGDTGAARFDYLGLTLDVQQRASWLLAAAAVLLGAFGLRWAVPPVRRAWDALVVAAGTDA